MIDAATLLKLIDDETLQRLHAVIVAFGEALVRRDVAAMNKLLQDDVAELAINAFDRAGITPEVLLGFLNNVILPGAFEIGSNAARGKRGMDS